jgi:uncharacterized protein
MNDDLTEPLDDVELDELNAILAARGEGDGLALDAVHGFVTAVAIGPGRPAPGEWLAPLVEDGRAFESTEQAERAIVLILRLHNMVLQDLERMAYEPILGQQETEGGETTLTAHGWCEGFSLGVDLRGDDWEQRMRDDPRLLDLLGPVIQLAADEGVFESEPGEELPPLSETEYDSALAGLAGSVSSVQQYWRDHPPGSPLPPADPVASAPRRRAGRWVH